jgi:hypothetical protein
MISREGKKLQTLKYMNVQWITVPPLTVRPLSSSVSMRPSPVLTRKNSFIEEEKMYPFMNSSISFTRSEMKLLARREESSLGTRLYKSPSKLQQLQREAEERELERMQLTKQKKQESPVQVTKQKLIEREDSYISINFDREDEYISDESIEQIVTNDEEKKDVSTAAVTQDDIEKSVWLYANSKQDPDVIKRIVYIDGKITKSDGDVAIDIRPTPGMRKLRRTIAITSPTADTLDSMSLDSIITQQQRQEEQKLNKAITDSYSGSKLREYLDSHQMKAPDFLDNVVYRKLPTRVNAKPKIPSKSPRRKISI